MITIRKTLVGIAVLLIIATNCSPPRASPTAAQLQLYTTEPPAPPAQASTPTKSPSPTTQSPSEMPPVEATVTFSPDIAATNPKQMAGVWFVKNFRGMGGNVNFPADLTFRSDGTWSFDGKDGMHILGGALRFENGLVTLESDECYDEVKTLFYHCTMTATVFVTMQTGKPVGVRLVFTPETKGVFVTNLNNRALKPDEP